MFILEYDLPMNFDYGWEDFDHDYHLDPHPFPELRPRSDPCDWPDDFKTQVNAERDKNLALYDAWCRREDAEDEL